VKFYRLYTGDDDRSHFESLDAGDASELFSEPHRVKQLVFRKEHRPHILDWHNAPRRQWVITLSGAVEIGVGDGTVMSFGPGDVFLAEDLTGQGHTAKPDNWMRAFIHVDG
jgi:hypothetical protein